VKLGGREVMIIASLALHGVIAMAALSVAHEKKARRATTVSLADEPKKKPEPPRPPPPPPPPPKPRPPRPVAPTPEPVAPEPAPVAHAAPVQTDTVMSNEVGMDIGTGQKPRDEIKPGPAPAKPKPAAAPVKTPIKPDRPDGATDNAGACTEPPGKPEPTLKTDIEYTEEARAAGIEGRLVLKVTVDASGLVTDVVVVASVDPALDAAAIATVKTWKFRPALACGKPVAGGTYTIARRFVLGD
jgi:periplasmic protein TonB